MGVKVLVLDAKQRSALAVTRSLGCLADVEVTTADASDIALAGCSRFSHDYLECPDAEREPLAFIDWLAQLLESRRYDLLIPVTEITSQLILRNLGRFASLHLPFADYHTVMQLADKGELVKLAESQNIPCPQSRWFARAAEVDVESVEFPIVLKPCLSKIYTGDAWVATRVRVLYSQAELLNELQVAQYLQWSPFMLQEFIPGHGAGLFCLYDRGTPQAFFAHRRLREKPPEGGVSVLSESVPVDPLLQQHAVTLLNSVNWHGVAMVEFRIAPDGTAYLMEVNTRFWGSLQLSIDAGVDFPRLLLAAEIAKTTGQAPEQMCANNYLVGQQLRWLLGDVDSLYLYLKGHYSAIQKLQRIVRFFMPRIFRRRHEINRWGDMGPARHEISLYVKQLLGR